MKKRSINECVYILFVMIFITMFLYAGFSCIRNIYNPIFMKEYLFGTVFSICIIMFCVLSTRHYNKLTVRAEIVYIIFIMLFAFTLRWFSILIMKTTQVSDFLFPHKFIQISKGVVQDEEFLNYMIDYYAKYPAWFPYMKLLNIFYNIFCKGEITIEAVKYANAVLNSITCGGIYYVGRSFFSKRVAALASIMYCCFPSLIIWVNVTTPDHITMILLVLQMIVWFWMWNIRNNKKVCIILVCLYSSICVLINWFKPLSILFILVFLFFFLATYTSKEKKQLIMLGKIFVLSFTVFYWSSNWLLAVWIEQNIQKDVVDSSWYYIYVGNTMTEEGTWDRERGDRIASEVFKKYDDLKEQMKEFRKMAIEELCNNKLKVPLLWLNKYDEALSNEGVTWYWCNTNNQNEYNEKLYETIGLAYHFIANQYYLCIILLVALCGISQLSVKYKDKNIFYLFLIVSGFIGILILSGVQSRYKIIVMPLIVLLCAYGLESSFYIFYKDNKYN